MKNPIPEQREQWDDDMTEQELADKRLFEGTTFASANAEFDDDESKLLEAEWCDEIDESDFENDEYDEEEFNFERMYDDVGDQDWG